MSTFYVLQNTRLPTSETDTVQVEDGQYLSREYLNAGWSIVSTYPSWPYATPPLGFAPPDGTLGDGGRAYAIATLRALLDDIYDPLGGASSVYTPQHFGANTTGTGDHTSAFTAMAASGESAFDLGPYSYNIDGAPTFGEGVLLVGRGGSAKGTDRAVTNLVHQSTGSQLHFRSAGFGIRDVLVDGNNLATSPLYFGGTSTGDVGAQPIVSNLTVMRAAAGGAALTVDGTQNGLAQAVNLLNNAGEGLKLINHAGGWVWTRMEVTGSGGNNVHGTDAGNHTWVGGIFERALSGTASDVLFDGLVWYPTYRFEHATFASGGVAVSGTTRYLAEMRATGTLDLDSCQFAGITAECAIGAFGADTGSGAHAPVVAVSGMTYFTGAGLTAFADFDSAAVIDLDGEVRGQVAPYGSVPLHTTGSPAANIGRFRQSSDTISRTTSTNRARASVVNGEGYPRFEQLVDGTQKWSSGAAAADVVLTRNGAGQVYLTGSQTASGDLVAARHRTAATVRSLSADGTAAADLSVSSLVVVQLNGHNLTGLTLTNPVVRQEVMLVVQQGATTTTSMTLPLAADGFDWVGGDAGVPIAPAGTGKSLFIRLYVTDNGRYLEVSRSTGTVVTGGATTTLSNVDPATGRAALGVPAYDTTVTPSIDEHTMQWNPTSSKWGASLIPAALDARRTCVPDSSPTGGGTNNATALAALFSQAASEKREIKLRGMYRSATALTHGYRGAVVVGADHMNDGIYFDAGGLKLGDGAAVLAGGGQISYDGPGSLLVADVMIYGTKSGAASLTSGLTLDGVPISHVNRVLVSGFDIGFDMVNNCGGTKFDSIKSPRANNLGMLVRATGQSGSDITVHNGWMHGLYGAYCLDGATDLKITDGQANANQQGTGTTGSNKWDSTAAIIVGRSWGDGTTGSDGLPGTINNGGVSGNLFVQGVDLEGTRGGYCAMRSYGFVNAVFMNNNYIGYALSAGAVGISPAAYDGTDPGCSGLAKMTGAGGSTLTVTGGSAKGTFQSRALLNLSGSAGFYLETERVEGRGGTIIGGYSNGTTTGGNLSNNGATAVDWLGTQMTGSSTSVPTNLARLSQVTVPYTSRVGGMLDLNGLWQRNNSGGLQISSDGATWTTLS